MTTSKDIDWTNLRVNAGIQKILLVTWVLWKLFWGNQSCWSYKAVDEVLNFILSFRYILSTYFLRNIYHNICLTSVTQNQTRKWHFPLNFCNGINWTGASSKAFGSSEALILVLYKNACLYDNISNSFQSKTLYIVLIFKWSCSIPIYEFAICASVKKHANRTPTFGKGYAVQKILQKVVQLHPQTSLAYDFWNT